MAENVPKEHKGERIMSDPYGKVSIKLVMSEEVKKKLKILAKESHMDMTAYLNKLIEMNKIFTFEDRE